MPSPRGETTIFQAYLRAILRARRFIYQSADCYYVRLWVQNVVGKTRAERAALTTTTTALVTAGLLLNRLNSLPDTFGIRRASNDAIMRAWYVDGVIVYAALAIALVLALVVLARFA